MSGKLLEPLVLEQKRSAGDNLMAEIDYEGQVSIEVEEPWAGDTETGFGRSGAIRLDRDQVFALASWLLKAAEIMKDTHGNR